MLWAVPARRTWSDVQLKDGSVVSVMLVGDEFCHWYVDRENRPLVIEDGEIRYLTASEIASRRTRSARKLERIAKHRAERLAKARPAFDLSGASNGRQRSIEDAKRPYSGEKRGLVILANYADKSMVTANASAAFNDMFNKVGYNKFNHVGSVHDYFYDQSYGQFSLQFDVVGPVTVSRNMSYYGQNDKDDDDMYPCKFVAEAVTLADKAGTDFSKYDWDGDGEVDMVLVIYAGYGEASTGADKNTIWPHEWMLSEGALCGDGNGPVTFDGVKIDTYAVVCELYGISGTTISGIGTACHEFAHSLGYPDLYNTNYDGGGGMSVWDLMHSGNYNGPNDRCEVPAGFSAYERWMGGWLEPEELSEPCFVTDLPALCDSPRAYIIYNNSNRNEAYILENRQAKKWDSMIGGANCHGMLISHIDYDEKAWVDNTVNDDKYHQRVTYFPADNSFGSWYDSYGMYTTTHSQTAGDPFPGTQRKTAFTDTTLPAATLYNAAPDGRKFMGKPITDIVESADGTISFTFMGGIKVPSVPEVPDTVEVNKDGFAASWDAADYADTYSLRVYKFEPSAIAKSCVLSEDCSGFSGTPTGSDYNLPLDNVLDRYTNATGWTGSRIYSGEKRIKIGTSALKGVLRTPLLSAPTTGSVTVYADILAYSLNEQTVNVLAKSADGKTTYASQSVNVPASSTQRQYSLVNMSGIKGDYRLEFEGNKRCYFYDIRVYDGTYSASDMEVSYAPERSVRETMHNDTLFVDGITATSYVVTGLAPDLYRYQVKGVNDKGESAWSKPVTVKVLPTGITEITADAAERQSGIYNINGQRVKSVAYKPGIYIVGRKKVVVQ